MERYYQRERQLMELDDERERQDMERYFEIVRFMEREFEFRHQEMERELERLMAEPL